MQPETAVPVDALHPLLLDPLLSGFLREDLGWGDLTSSLVLPPDVSCRAAAVFREAGVVAGLAVFRRVFHLVDPAIRVTDQVLEGADIAAGQTVVILEGPARSVMTGERVALNLLQRMSAVATLTRAWVRRLEGTRTRLLDTRKTTPGLRTLERHAVRVGGGRNHRFCLSDAVLIKDNHIAICGSIREAVARARAGLPLAAPIEVEVETLPQLEEALAAGADMIMLDNMDDELVAQAVVLVAGRIPLEASGGISLERLASLGRTGVDHVSAGALTRQAGFLDIALDIVTAA
ncbi:MAG: carboxylating nicotinate-nucleotide diphosphorylase [Candidatus Sericytochromatia bacterium]|nr:carboxylating nicotinate-nucleotide diphosphorylase [Candidatus Sericytochromatia bacterium]